MITPVVGHAVCDLDSQRRLFESAVERRLRSAGRKAGRRRRIGRRTTAADFAFDFRAREGDVWHALRF